MYTWVPGKHYTLSDKSANSTDLSTKLSGIIIMNLFIVYVYCNGLLLQVTPQGEASKKNCLRYSLYPQLSDGENLVEIGSAVPEISRNKATDRQ